MHRQMRWGIAFPIVAAALTGGAWLLASKTDVPDTFYENVLPWIGIVLASVSFLVGHISYPRIHNLKVYLLGWLTGLSTLAYFVCVFPPAALKRFQVFPDAGGTLYLIVFANLVATALVPAFVKYHVTKFITWSVAVLETIVIVLACTAPWMQFLSFPGDYAWAGVAAGLLLVALTVVRMLDQFYLGGVVAGCAILYGAAWVQDARIATQLGDQFGALAFAVSVLFFELGILFHWFVRIEHRVKYDPLLHIYNREHCTRILAEQSKLNSAPPFTIAMVDIDHFKKVNDTHGHQAGDAVLYAVAQTISRAVIPKGTLCRYGGEELAVFFAQQTSQQVRKVMEDARILVSKTHVATGRKRITVTVSIGISTRTESTQTLQEVLQSADKALYRAKQGGRNQVRLGAARKTRRK
jgi:diguanylate cyclase (GGDEF)-like protein